MDRLKIGLLPMYVEMYDRFFPQMRAQIDMFRRTIAEELGKRGLIVAAAPVCRVKREFEEAAAFFEMNGAEAIVTLHLAYSPSLESSEVLAAARLPIIVLDTTPAYGFGPAQAPEQIDYNHGIHGVQDMCSMLRRNNKRFFLEAGHWEKSDVLDRVAGCARAVRLAERMRGARVGRIGSPFAGMGDFLVSDEVMRRKIGIETVVFGRDSYSRLAGAVGESDIDAEIAADEKRFNIKGLDREVYRRAAAVNLAVREWIKEEKLTAFTVNFMAIGSESGLPCMPFLEAGKAMARGTGYAGEGDVLTAALVGALASVYGEVSFSEMFCPDWESNTIFVSHMGEMNIDLTAEAPELKTEAYPYTDGMDAVSACGRFKEGRCVIVNLAPSAGERFSLIISAAEMMGVSGDDRLTGYIRGWIRPRMAISEFLTAYSQEGGTHHIALVYGDVQEEIKRFGQIMGWRVVEI